MLVNIEIIFFVGLCSCSIFGIQRQVRSARNWTTKTATRYGCRPVNNQTESARDSMALRRIKDEWFNQWDPDPRQGAHRAAIVVCVFTC